MERKLITKFDILLISIFAAVIAGVFAFNYFSEKNDNLIAEIYFDGKLIEKADLSENEEKRIVTGEHEDVIIVARDGEIYFEESSCHDKTCVLSKPLNSSGDFTACLPNKVIIKVVGEKKTAPDAISY